MKGVLLRDKEAETVVIALYTHWIIGVNGNGHGAPTKHVYRYMVQSLLRT